MKKIVLTLLFLLTSAFAEVTYTNMFDVYDEAKAQNKEVLVMLSQKGCSACEYMEGVVFANKDVEAYLKKSFIVAHVDIHEEYVPEELEHFATPTFYFLNADEEILKRVDGAANAKDFLQILKEVEALK